MSGQRVEASAGRDRHARGTQSRPSLPYSLPNQAQRTRGRHQLPLSTEQPLLGAISTTKTSSTSWGQIRRFPLDTFGIRNRADTIPGAQNTRTKRLHHRARWRPRRITSDPVTYPARDALITGVRALHLSGVLQVWTGTGKRLDLRPHSPSVLIRRSAGNMPPGCRRSRRPSCATRRASGPRSRCPPTR